MNAAPSIEKEPQKPLYTASTRRSKSQSIQTEVLPTGARAYYFCNILHEFPFNSCVEILRQTMAAMTPGYSKILINELVIPDENAGTFMIRSDFTMMTLLSAMERSETQWRELLGFVGLKVIEIWTAELESERTIECVLG